MSTVLTFTEFDCKFAPRMDYSRPEGDQLVRELFVAATSCPDPKGMVDWSRGEFAQFPVAGHEDAASWLAVRGCSDASERVARCLGTFVEPQQIEYVAILRDVRAGTTKREYFRAPHRLEAAARYAGRGNVDSHVGPVAIRIRGVVPISAVKRGEVVTLLNPDDSIGAVGYVVTGEDDEPRVRCFFE